MKNRQEDGKGRIGREEGNGGGGGGGVEGGRKERNNERLVELVVLNSRLLS